MPEEITKTGEFVTVWIDGLSEEERPIVRMTEIGPFPFINPGEMLTHGTRIIITKIVKIKTQKKTHETNDLYEQLRRQYGHARW